MKDKILQAEGEELSRLLGEVLADKPYRCCDNLIYGECERCGQFISRTDGVPDFGELACSGPDPIPLDDWNVAMAWRDWMKENHLFEMNEHFETVWRHCRDDCFEPWGRWFTLYAQPKHYLQAAAICKVEG